MEDAFLCAKHGLTLLQTKTVELRAKASREGTSEKSKKHISRTIAAYLSQLQLVHTAVREFLLRLAKDAAAPSADTNLLECLKSIAEEVPGLDALEQDRPGDLAAQVRQARAARLDDEGRALRAAVSALPAGVHADPDALEAVVRNLSRQEQSLEFHVRLAAEVSERFGGGLSYSADNFSYGSTPYTSWLKVVDSAGRELREAMAASRGREYVVWGSSCGWLVMYGALTYGWCSRGVELLSCLHACAQKVADECKAALSAGRMGVGFTCGDLLQDDASNAGLVVLADQCWDPALSAAAAAKLARELPAGALCVSYSGNGFRSQAGEGTVADGGSHETKGAGAAAVEVPLETAGVGAAFLEVASLKAPVSWAEAQTFHVFQKRL